jgi:type II secretory pathway component GspD/PulD (secretin)
LSSVQANLSLDVTPQVTSDGNVLMKIDLKRDTPDDKTRGDLTTREAVTEMLVESGKTAVVGGIYTLDKTNTTQGWPWLSHLPIFGALFRDLDVTSNSSNELLMFISPTILNPDKTFLSYGGSTLEDEMDTVKDNSKGVEKISAKADKTSADDDLGGLDAALDSSESGPNATSVKPQKNSKGGGDGLDDLDNLDDLPDDLL